MTDTAKQASQFETIELSVELFRQMKAETAALREEVGRLRSALHNESGSQSCPICGVSEPHRHDDFSEVIAHLERQALRFGRKVKVVPIPDDAGNFAEPGFTLACQLADVHSLHRASSIINHAFEAAFGEGQKGSE